MGYERTPLIKCAISSEDFKNKKAWDDMKFPNTSYHTKCKKPKKDIEFYSYIVRRNGMKKQLVRMYKDHYIHLREKEMMIQNKNPDYKDPILQEFREAAFTHIFLS